MTEVNPSGNSTAASSREQVKPKTTTIPLPSDSEFLGISKKNQSAVFELTLLSGEKNRIEVAKDQILGEIKSALAGERKIEEIPHLTNANFNRVVNLYYKQNLLPSSIIELIREKQARPKAEALAKKPVPEAAHTDTVVASKDDTDSQVGKTLKVENFSMKDDKKDFLKDLFSKQKSKVKILTEDLAPHFRHILAKPSLTDKEIREARTDSTSSSQQTTNLKRLRDELLKAIQKNETVSLPNWLKTDIGTMVQENLEPVLYDVAAQVHRQVQHQLEKGKEADQKVIDNQVLGYIKATNILASIVRRTQASK